MTLPDPPVNVRLVMVDETEVPVDTVYVGFQKGTHFWKVVNAPPNAQIRGMKIAQLPTHTSVVVQVD